MYVCPRKWAWLFQFETFWKPLILPGKKRGLEAFRAFSCVFYISTSNVVQFGSITHSNFEGVATTLANKKATSMHRCFALLSEIRISKRRCPFDISYFVNNSNVLNSYILSSRLTYWFKKTTIEFAALSNDFILQSNFRASKKPILVISNN